MKTREEALAYALSFPKTYQEAPFHDNNWQLVRVEGSKKAFLWTYEREGYINLNVKADPQWRDFWRSTYASVIPGWHQNKDHWNTIILDGTVPEQEIQRMRDEAKANEAKDKEEKERIDKINAADSNIFATEKQLKEYGDKLPADKKSAIEGALAKLKEAHKNADVAAIDTAIAELNAAWQAASQDIYAQQQAQGAQPGADAGQSQSQANAGGASNGGDSSQPEDVEFEEVK